MKPCFAEGDGLVAAMVAGENWKDRGKDFSAMEAVADRVKKHGPDTRLWRWAAFFWLLCSDVAHAILAA